MKPVSYFQNGLLCNKHKHGASCAIDALLELYFYGVYLHDSSSNSRQDLFVTLLNETCEKRKFVQGVVDCSIREPVWNWLVRELKGAYSPKGTHEAEIIQGVRALISHHMDLFEARFKCACYCNVCTGSYNVFDSNSHFILSTLNLQRCNGSVEKTLEMEIVSQLTSRLKQHRSCKPAILLGDAEISLPKFVVVELGLIEGRNCQVPPVQVKEDITVSGLHYTLTAAIVMRKGHFLNVVKDSQGFIRIDGKPLSGGNTFWAQTFSGALKGDLTNSQKVHVTSPNDLGIHVLLYKRYGSTGEGVLLCGEYQKSLSSEPSALLGKIETIECYSSEEDDPPSENVQSHTKTMVAGRSGNNEEKWDFHSPLKTSTPKKRKPKVSSVNQNEENIQFPYETSSWVTVKKKGNVLSQHKNFALSPKSGKEKNQATSHDYFLSKNIFKGLEDEVKDSVHSSKKETENCPDVFPLNCIQGSKAQQVNSSFPSKQSVKSKTSKRKPLQEVQKNTLDSQSSLSQSKYNVFKEDSNIQEICINWEDNTLVLDSKKVQFQFHSTSIFLKCPDIFSVLDMTSHVHNKGYTQIEKRLSEHGKENCFLYENKRRKFIKLDAVLTLLDAKRGWWKDKHTRIKGLLMNLQQRLRLSRNPLGEMNNNCSIDVNTATTEEQSLSSTGDDHSNDCSNSSASQQAEQVDYLKRKFEFLKTKKYVGRRRRQNFLKSSVSNIISNVWKGNKQMFLKDIGCLIKPTGKQTDSNIFDKNEIVSVLKGVPASKKGKQKYDNLLQEISSENYKTPMTVEDIVNLEENFSGTRLFDEMRKKLPNVLPPRREEYIRKRQYSKEFKSVLLPKRTSTGWAVDPERLLEVLHFKYYWLEENKYWRIYGDGREVGGRSSTFVSISVLNNEIFLHGFLFQSPKEVYPLYIFYEADSRDNLEENLEYPHCPLDVFFQKKMENNHTFYVTGDEMFLEALLDGNNQLNPTSSLGWNIYAQCSLESKQSTSTRGFRTELKASINRQCPTSILKSVPLENYVFCLLHGLARSVEKLLNLVVSDVLSEANIAQQRGEDRTAYIDERLTNLENNINRRGVRQGNFRIHFDKHGKPEPVKLNKDCALTIIAPTPQNKENDFPHVLTNVSTNRPLGRQLRKEVQRKLSLKALYTEATLEKEIWHHFYKMVIIVKNDPAPILVEGKEQGSLNPEDYVWGYTKQQKESYVHHAECFYQLFVLRYSSKNLTPYMIKFIDYAPIFMEQLPFSMGRYQSEAGEHANYLHNCFYYQHTTRHGGSQKADPVLAIFCNMWKNLAYSICSGDGTESGKKVCADFKRYVSKHVSAKIIQKWWRTVSWKKKQVKSVLCIQNFYRRWKAGNACVKHQKSLISGKVTCNANKLSFENYHFVMCGAIPVLNGRKYSQASLREVITSNHGRVCDRLPVGKNKFSSKKYTVLVSEKVCVMKTLPSQVKHALRLGHKVLRYNFISDSVTKGQLLNESNYVIKFSGAFHGVNKGISLQSKHFSRRKSMKSLMKGKRKSRWKQRRVKVGVNPCVRYVWQRMKTIQKHRKLSFEENRQLFSQFMSEWHNLPNQRKQVETEAWRRDIAIQQKHEKGCHKNTFAYFNFYSNSK